LIASNASIKAALEPVKVFKHICDGRCAVSRRLTVQSLSLD
jgi:hypothetical protein